MSIEMQVGAPPLPPLFLKFNFLEKVRSEISPESKINIIRPLVPSIRYLEVKNVDFSVKMTKGGAKSGLQIEKIIDFSQFRADIQNEIDCVLRVI